MVLSFYRRQLAKPYVKRYMAWTDIFVLEPASAIVTEWVSPLSWLSPNSITCISFLINSIAVYFYTLGGTANWVIGAVIWQLGYVLDGVDGKLARKRGITSPFGAKLDVTLDKAKKVMCLAAIWWSSPEAHQLWLGLIYVGHYGLQIWRVAKSSALYDAIHRHRVREVFEPLDVQNFMILLGPLTGQPLLFAALASIGLIIDRMAHLTYRGTVSNR
ncbi:MAG: CDP-alcohol phosphatidyltransferase family protein [Candidatus Didemnitutus sp.]|nr:CDP-alcohol phosphatidyltransferase family protein [Candidatus Didemnitutus sp.]